MENIVFIIMISTLALVLVISILVIIRNEFVHNYRIGLCDKGYYICLNHLNNSSMDEIDFDYQEELEKMWISLLKDHSYDEMLYKFWKPLKDKYWLTKEQIEFLNLKFN